MTKIKNYPLDLQVNGGDKWIGTDSASLAKLTKNFTPDNLATYYNNSEVVQVVNQMRFFYDTVDPGDDRASGSFSFPTEVGPTVPFSSITDLVFSKYTMGNDAVNNFMTDIVNSIIIIQKSDNPDIYAFYALNAYTVDPLDANFYNVELSFESGNGSVEEDEDYLIGLIQFAGASGVQTILGSEFIDSTLTGVGEVTISLSATGTPSNLTGLRGDNTWGTLGLESLNEGGRQSFGSTDPTIGWRLIGRDSDNYGNIGQDAIDFSTGYFQNETLPFGGSITNSPQIGSVGPGSFTLGSTVENNSGGGVVFGSGNVLNGGPNIEPTYFVGGVILGQYNQSYGLNYYNFTSGYKNLIGDRTQAAWSDAGFPYPYPVQYWSGQIGMYNQMPSGYASVQLGYGLLSGGPFCTTVGLANEDVTLSIAENIVNNRNALNPRFIVGCGTFAGNTANPSVGLRQNGFVVMSDGTATFPLLTNALIDAAGDDSAVTKGWVNAGPALTSEQVRIEVKNTSGVTLAKGTPVYITGTVGATIRAEVAAADASSSATMPAVGVLAQDLINNEDGFAVTGGFLTNITTDPIDGLTPTENDTVFVKAGGGLTLTKPTGSDLIQNIAKVGKVSGGNAGSLVISSILRTNDVPNLTEGKIWVGTAANTAESGVVYLDEGNVRMGIGLTNPSSDLEVQGGTSLSAIGFSGSTVKIGDYTGIGTTRIFSNGSYIGYSTANSYHDFSNAGASQVRITSTGNVGIGTTSPSFKLDIDSGTSNSALRVLSTDRYTGIRFEDSLNNDTLFYDGQDGLMYLASTNFRAVDLYATGNVGIGTTSPAQLLHLESSSPKIRLEDSDGTNQWAQITEDNGALSIVSRNNTTAGVINLQTYDGTTTLNTVTLKAGNQVQFNQYGSGTFTGTATQRLAVDSSGNVIEIPIGSGPVDGSGTANYVTKWSDTDTITDSLLYDSGSRIGIGTATPNESLDIQRASAGIRLTDTNGGSRVALNNILGDFTIDKVGNENIILKTNGNERLRVTGAGNVGIGTTSPNHLLHVSGNASVTNMYLATNIIHDGDTNTLIGFETDAIKLTTAGSERLRITPTGNVGIGTTGPANKLHVVGSQRIDQSADWDGLNIYGFDDQSSDYLKLHIGTTPMARYQTNLSHSFYVGNSRNFDIFATSISFSVDTKRNDDLVSIFGTNNDSYIGYSNTDNRLKIGFGSLSTPTVDSNTKLSLDASGVYVTNNLGVGTTSPAAKLDVNGDSSYSSDYNFLSISGTKTGGTAVTDVKGIDLSIGSGDIVAGNDITNLYGAYINNNTSGGSASVIGNWYGVYVPSADANRVSNRVSAYFGDNVGIGTTSPSQKLHVDGITYSTSGYKLDNGFSIGALGYNSAIRFNNGNILVNNSSSSEFVRFDATNSRVGIGTTSPAYKLTSYENTAAGAIVASFGNPINVNAYTAIGLSGFTASNGANKAGIALKRVGNFGTGELHFLNNNTLDNSDVTLSDSKMMIDSSGNVGIGTTSPQEKLDISAGNIRLDDSRQITWATTDANVGRVRISGSETADIINFVTDNSERMRLTNTGLGIGTTSPAFKLTVNSGTDNTIARFASTDGTGTIVVADNAGSAYFSRLSNKIQIGGTSGDSALNLTVLDTGNVGIGNNSPTNKLSVLASLNTYAAQYIRNSGTGAVLELNQQGTGNIFEAFDNSSSVFIIKDGGNVGIGTTNPAAKLDVNGGVRVADDAATASATNVGTLRYRTSGNNSYVDMCMQTGAATYAWVNIVQNNW